MNASLQTPEQERIARQACAKSLAIAKRSEGQLRVSGESSVEGLPCRRMGLEIDFFPLNINELRHGAIQVARYVFVQVANASLGPLASASPSIIEP